jgi:hypothetical protein
MTILNLVPQTKTSLATVLHSAGQINSPGGITEAAQVSALNTAQVF